MDLSADLGNSALKLALWPPGPELAAEPLALFGAPDPADPLACAPPALRAAVAEGGLALAVLSSVGDAARTARVEAALRDLATRVVVAPDPGLHNACEHPETVGPDRLYAARGALEEAPGGALVLDAGTALTVDAVVAPRDPADGRGRFLGGAIAPGPELGARALVEYTAALPRVEPRPGVRALGRHTREALLSGLVVGFRGAAAELARQIAREAELGDAPWFLTGGARQFLLEPDSVLAAPRLEVRPALVHRGLLAAARGERP